MDDPRKTATLLLRDIQAGDREASEQLINLVYEDLRHLAVRMMREERRDHTLDPTSVVHEAYLRLVNQDRTTWRDRVHFFAVAAEMMRRVLVDHARTRGRLKRGGDRVRVTFSEAGLEAVEPVAEIDVLALDQSLERLAALNQRQADVVKLRYFAGLTNEEVASVLGVHRSTIADDWSVARAWLSADMDDAR